MLSLCMIVRNEEKVLGRCLSSIAPYVQEIVIVDTGSTDNTRTVAEKFGARWFEYTPETNPEGFYLDDESSGCPGPYTKQMHLCNFGAARNMSFDKATQPWRMWLDADDVVRNAETIPEILKAMQPHQAAVAKYQISPSALLVRERIIHASSQARWAGACHEVMVGVGQRVLAPFVIEHHRDPDRKGVSHRNFKIMHRELHRIEESGGAPEPRLLFYYAQELSYIDNQRGVAAYERYLKSSTWSEERHLARIRAGSMLEHVDPNRAAEHFAAAVVIERPEAPDGWFGLARLAYFKEQWQKCIEYSEKGFALGNPAGVLPYDEHDRIFRPHWYYNVALNRTGRVEEALASCKAGLKHSPQDKWLSHNFKIYSDFLDRKAGKFNMDQFTAVT